MRRTFAGLLAGLGALGALGCGSSVTDVPAPPLDGSAPQLDLAAAADAGTPLPAVVTWHNDNAHTGQNRRERILTRANVRKATFGKLFALPVDDFLYAQPLYVPAVDVAGTPHDMVFAATVSDSVYGFDADAAAPPIWQRSFVNPGAGIIATPTADTGNQSDLISASQGILGTPVIDRATSTLYVVVNTREGTCPTPPTGCTYPFRLHALDLATGADKLAPVIISAQVPGTGGGSKSGVVRFEGLYQMQRPGLTLDKGVVYVAFGSHGDFAPDQYHGWVLGYRARDLAQVFVFNTTPNRLADSGADRGQGAIWQSGASVAADSTGNLYVETANGLWDGVKDFGDSVLEIGPSAALVDWFTPSVQAALNDNDVDLGSAGVTLLPDQTGATPHEAIATGKPGVLYVLDRDAMGHYSATGDAVLQTVNVNGLNTTGIGSGVFATAAYWNGSLYIAGVNDMLKAFSVSGGQVSVTPTSSSSLTYPYPGATPAVSSNGNAQGIVWTIQGAGYSSGSPAVLHAYNADDLSRQLYTSAQSGARDRAGGVVKFTTPTVAAGKVYVGTVSEIDVYGLLP